MNQLVSQSGGRTGRHSPSRQAQRKFLPFSLAASLQPCLVGRAGWVGMEQRTRDELLRAIDCWITRAHEPSLDDLLADPGIRPLMASDGVSEAAVRQLAREVWERISAPNT